MNSDDEKNEYIRSPDPVIRETLLEPININHSYNNSIYDFEEDDCVFFEDILRQSREEYEKEQLKRHIQNELLEKERLEKKLICTSITQKINKIKGYDTANKNIYETVNSIIEMYEMDHIINFVTQKNQYENIFKVLSSLRITSDEMHFLRNLIIL